MARSITAEIVIHLAVLFFVLFPILTVLFPGLLLLVGATMLANFFAPESNFAAWIGESGLASFTIACLVALIAVGSAFFKSNARQSSVEPNKLRQPSGRDGQTLQNTVADLWKEISGSSMPPAVRWFPSMDISAYAEHSTAGSEIQISAGLWRAIVSNHPTARAILAHEIAHLFYHDPYLLRWIERIVIASRSVTLVTAIMGIFTLAIVLGHQIYEILSYGQSISAALIEFLRIVTSACVVLIILPLGWLALRRQIAFITSLIEIRADIVAALWTDGLEGFTQIFAENENVIHSTRRDLIVAILSPNLTHIPLKERLEILSKPEYIITPKIRFFAFSLLLAFLIPINFATPLLYGGSINYLIMLSLSCSLNIVIVAMLLMGTSDKRHPIFLSVNRRVILAVAVCTIGALPRINLEPISYLVMSWLVGFGGQPMDWSELPHDLLITGLDLSKQAGEALFNPFGLLAIGTTYIAVTFLAITLSKPAKFQIKHRWIAPVIATGTASIIASFDSNRFPLPSNVIEMVNLMNEPISIHHTFYLCLPLLSAAIMDSIQQFVRWIGYKLFGSVAYRFR